MSSAINPSKPFIRRSHEGDLWGLSETLRLADRLEIAHSSGASPYDALARGFRHSESFTIEWRGAPVAMFGVCGEKGCYGSPWMLGTDDLKRCWSLLRECRERVERYTEEYTYLTNAVWSKNTVHIEWIKWLGFTFEGSELRNGETFLYFHRSRHV